MNELLKYEGSVDAEIEQLMAPGSAYWRPEDPNHAKAVQKVTELHRRRFGG